MIKKLTLATVALLLALGLSAQTFTGGVRGTVVSRADRSPVPGAVLVLYQGTAEVATVTSGDDGRFLIEDLDNGIYDLVIQAPDYLETRVNVTVSGDPRVHRRGEDRQGIRALRWNHRHLCL